MLPLTWIENYLTNRKQRLILNNVTSNNADIICGVPQGSVLGPLLFLIYINDLPHVIKNCESFNANDTVISTSAINSFTAHRNLQCDVNNLTDWCCKNKLIINVKKTKCMILGS